METSGDKATTVAGQIRRTVLATSLLRVLADYVAQALDETRSLAREGEDRPEEAFPAEMSDLQGRLRRVRVVLHTLQRWRRQSAHDTHGQRPGDMASGGRAVCCALEGLHALYAQMAPHELPHCGAGDDVVAIASNTLRRLGRPASLLDAALELNGRNAYTAYRRASSHGGTSGGAAQRRSHQVQETEGVKRLRDATGQSTSLALSTLASEQRAARRELYSGRAVLLPRVEAAMTPFFVSPAVRRYAELNAAAEAAMLRDAWRVHTKAHLLRDLPRLQEAVRSLRVELHTWLGEHRASVMRSSSNSDETLPHTEYFSFDEVDEGVVRVWVQRALCLDVTYDMVRQVWLVLRLHWNVWLTASGAASNARDLVLAGYDARHTAAATTPLRRVQPPHQPVMLQYLQRRFAEGGFDEGCLAAQRLLCTVVLDTMAYQLTVLRQECFIGPLASLFSMDVRAGTYVACRFQPFVAQVAHTSATMSSDGTTEVQRTASVLVKCSVVGGTVVVERTWQGNVALQRGDLVLPLFARRLCTTTGLDEANGPNDEDGSSVSVIVLDVEQLLWDSALPL